MKFDKNIDVFNEDILNEVCRIMGIKPTQKEQEYFVEDNMKFEVMTYFDNNLNKEEYKVFFNNDYNFDYSNHYYGDPLISNKSYTISFDDEIKYLGSAA